MYKVECVIKTMDDMPKSYSTMDGPLESEIWEAIHDILPASSKFLKHFVESRWTEDKDKEPYSPSFNKSLKIPVGTLSFILIVYYEK